MNQTVLTTYIVFNPEDSTRVRYTVPPSVIEGVSPPRGFWYALHGVRAMRTVLPMVMEKLEDGSRLCPVDVLVPSNYPPSSRLGLSGETPLLKDATVMSFLTVRDDLKKKLTLDWNTLTEKHNLPAEEKGFPKKPIKHPQLAANLLRLPEYSHINAVVMPYLYAGKLISLAVIRKTSEYALSPNLDIPGTIKKA